MVRELAADNSTCNYLLKELQDCYDKHSVRKHFGFCSPIFMELQRCIEIQQEARKEESLKRSKEFREKIRSSTRERNA